MNIFPAAAQEEVTDYYHSETPEIEVRDPKLYTGETAFSIVDSSFLTQEYFLSPDSVVNWSAANRYKKISNATDQLRNWKESKRNEARETPKQSSSWVNNLFNGNIADGFLWIVTAILIGFIVYRLVLNKGFFSSDKSAKRINEVDLNKNELFLKQDFDALSKSFEEKKDLRTAMRYSFLYTLNKMKQRGLIEFQIEKTNRKYISELDPKFKPAFAKLAKYYEYAWYGKINFTESEYQEIKKSFKEFNATI